MTSKAPRAFNREIYHDHPEMVFYGTDDGCQDGSFGEFAEFRSHYESVAPHRRENIHMVSVVGGLYGLNLIPSGGLSGLRSSTSIRQRSPTFGSFAAC